MNELAQTFWQAYLVNFIFWTGMAQGAIVLAATLDITGARWGGGFRRIVRSFAGFLPISVALFALMLLGRDHIFPWIAEPIPEKAAYLNMPFLALRGLAGLAALAWLSFMFIKRTAPRPPAADSSGSPPEHRASEWSVALIIGFMLIYTYVAFDLIMSLQPHWHSTLLGAHYAVSCFYLGIAGLVLVGSMRPEVAIGERHNLTTLMFGISPFWISLLWSQYVVIWYGDMPEETQFVYLRFYQMPWTAVTLVAIALAFVVPFTVLMPRRAKLKRALQFMVASCAILGLFVEKYVFIAPSFSPDELVIGWIYPLVTLAFAALFVMSYRFTARRIGPTRQP
jgi:hypothetical protein